MIHESRQHCRNLSWLLLKAEQWFIELNDPSGYLWALFDWLTKGKSVLSDLHLINRDAKEGCFILIFQPVVSFHNRCLTLLDKTFSCTEGYFGWNEKSHDYGERMGIKFTFSETEGGFLRAWLHGSKKESMPTNTSLREKKQGRHKKQV